MYNPDVTPSGLTGLKTPTELFCVKKKKRERELAACAQTSEEVAMFIIFISTCTPDFHRLVSELQTPMSVQGLGLDHLGDAVAIFVSPTAVAAVVPCRVILYRSSSARRIKKIKKEFHDIKQT